MARSTYAPVLLLAIRGILLAATAGVLVLGAVIPGNLRAQAFRLEGRIEATTTGDGIEQVRVAVLSTHGDTLATGRTEVDGSYDVRMNSRRVARLLPAEILRLDSGLERRTESGPTVAEFAAPPDTAPPTAGVFNLLGRRLEPGRSAAAGHYFIRLRFPAGIRTEAVRLPLYTRGPLSITPQRVRRSEITARLVVEKPGFERIQRDVRLRRGMREELFLTLAPELEDDTTMTVRSPDGRLQGELILGRYGDRDGCLLYRVRRNGRTVLRLSRLGLEVYGESLTCGLRVRSTSGGRRTGTRRPRFGAHAEVPDSFRWLILEVEVDGAPELRMHVVARAYDEGFAFRYRLPPGNPTETPGRRTGDEAPHAFRVPEEHTTFSFPAGVSAYTLRGEEDRYAFRTVDRIRNRVLWPMTTVYPDGRLVSLTEAGGDPTARMVLTPRSREPWSLGVHFSGSIESRRPWESAWRVLLVADSPETLLERRYLVENLSPPSRLGSSEWIRPGKAMRVATHTTEHAIEVVDFAVRRGLDYVEFDSGWYGEPKADGTNPLTAIPGLDLRRVIDYADERGVGVILYVHRRAFAPRREASLRHYADLGAAGIKLGFVPVGTQQWDRWLVETLRMAAEHRLVVDVHDRYVPHGRIRTYPHLLTQEGVRGNEHMPSAAHNATLPFTRALAGPTDYTISYYQENLQTTRAHQLALSVVLFSPLQFLYWYDAPADADEGPGPAFFAEVPTTWDETRVLEGAIGEYAAVARRSGSEWFLGAITDDGARTAEIELSFLDPGTSYRAYVYHDAPGSPRGEPVRLRTSRVNRSTVLRQRLAPSGGLAIRLVPE